MTIRKKTKKVKIGQVYIGGNSPISIQSMTNTKTSDIISTVKQIKSLEKAGCEIVRVAIPDEKSARSLKKIKQKINIPLVADIHFDHKLALISAPFVDKLRINPGNLKNEQKIKQVVLAAKKYKIPIRIGINLGSIDSKFEKKFGRNEKAMLASASEQINTLEKFDFKNIVVSLKSSDIETTIKACELFSKKFDYPQHLGITESGTLISGTVKSSIGIGNLLLNGIGDTIRVSLSSDPINEIQVASNILKHIHLKKGLKVVSCPTCARKGINTEYYASIVEKELGHLKTNKTVAIMGCVVNGPGEAKDADLAIVGVANSDPLLYKKGKYVRPIKKTKLISTIKKELIK